MGLIELIILSAGLAADAFAVSVCKGISILNVRKRDMAVVGLWFGLFQCLMPIIGFFSGCFFADMVSKYSCWISFSILCFLGIKMCIEAFETEKTDERIDVKTMFPLAVATSIDALAVGTAFAFLKVKIWTASIIIGFVTFIFSAAGVKIGNIFGTRYRAAAELCGGIILLLIGIKIMLDGFDII